MSSTITNDERCDTPACSSACDGSIGNVPLSHPIVNRSRNFSWKGGSFISRDPTTNFLIGLRKSDLYLVPESSRHKAWYLLVVRRIQHVARF